MAPSAVGAFLVEEEEEDEALWMGRRAASRRRRFPGLAGLSEGAAATTSNFGVGGRCTVRHRFSHGDDDTTALWLRHPAFRHQRHQLPAANDLFEMLPPGTAISIEWLDDGDSLDFDDDFDDDDDDDDVDDGSGGFRK